MKKLFGIMAEFKEASALLAAANKTRESGYKKFDTYSPFPIEGLDEAIGFPENGVPLISFAGGVLGGVTGFGMQWYAYVYDYPINVAGRPDFSWPSFIPVAFELTVLGAALFGVIGMLALNWLPEPHHPLFGADGFDRASRDRFFLCIETSDASFAADKTKTFLEGLSAEKVVEVYHED